MRGAKQRTPAARSDSGEGQGRINADSLITERTQLRGKVDALVAGYEAARVVGAEGIAARRAWVCDLDAAAMLRHGANDGAACQGLSVGDVGEHLRQIQSTR